MALQPSRCNTTDVRDWSFSRLLPSWSTFCSWLQQPKCRFKSSREDKPESATDKSSMSESLLQEASSSLSWVRERRPAKPSASSLVLARASQRWRSSVSLFLQTSAATARGRPISVTRPLAAAWGQAASAKSEWRRQSVCSKASCAGGGVPSRGRPATQLRMRRRSSSLLASAFSIVTCKAAPMISIGNSFSRIVFLAVAKTFLDLSSSVSPSASSCAVPPRGVVTMSRRKSCSSANRKVIASSNCTHIRRKTLAGSFPSGGGSTTSNTPRQRRMARKKLEAVGSAASSRPRSC
mmetsp:Transcript_110707/g.323892  ORF Transcript_110707/g.323892 Transcript_110707/m.323892 type:complete len:294 (-) Transcript_110707:320-1201(-)